ncbi:MAG: type II secretion system protein GspF [Desulfobacteraceae bacterium 4572_123]|nr:MAG: type II secretion system protein GspF [Desulfobacteraceae bacterium 4572_123]
MPVFEYTALNVKGKQISGILDSESAVTARQKLRSTRLFPVKITEVHDTDKITAIHNTDNKKNRRFLPSLHIGRRIKQSELAMLTRQLATLVGAGFQLVSALDTLLPQTKTPALNKRLAKIKDMIVEGQSFAGALSLYPETFSALYINMVRAGETSGTLEIVLNQLADITEKQQALNSRIRNALAYPVLMAFIGSVVLFLLLTFIVPSITGIFTDMNQTLPAPTLFLISLSDFFKSFWWIILIILIAIPIVLSRIKKTKKGRLLIDKAVLRTPLTGHLTKKIAAARFSRTLGSLLANGVSMLTALEIVKNIVGNALISNTIEEAAVKVGKGQGLGASLETSQIFPNLSTQMIMLGEQSGELETMLSKVADVYESEVESAVLGMTALLEPVMILVMGVIVGFIVLSICLPIFEMNQLVM